MSTDQTAVDLPPRVLDFLAERKTMTLATASQSGLPHASTFLYVNDGPSLYFWARPRTSTTRHVEQNPVVSFVIDEYTDDLRQTRGVQGTGECAVLLSGERIAAVADLFGQKFPDLSPGNTMSISFFRITPTEIQFIDNTATDSGGSAEGSFGADFHRERSYSVLTDLPNLEGDGISATLQTIEVAAGDVLVRQGGPADKFFIVVDGEIEVLGVTGTPSASYGPGQLVGEVSIIRDRPRMSTIQAKTASTLLAMDRDTFRDLVAQSLQTTSDFDQVIRDRTKALGA